MEAHVALQLLGVVVVELEESSGRSEAGGDEAGGVSTTILMSCSGSGGWKWWMEVVDGSGHQKSESSCNILKKPSCL